MIIMLIIYVPGIFFFSRPKNKEYFNWLDRIFGYLKIIKAYKLLI
jgi:hypothetical protein